MIDGAELVAGFRQWQIRNAIEAEPGQGIEESLPGGSDAPLLAELAAGFHADLTAKYGAEPKWPHEVYTRLSHLLFTLTMVADGHLNVRRIRQADRVFAKYREAVSKAHALLREAARLQQLPEDHYIQLSPDTAEPDQLSIDQAGNWRRTGIRGPRRVSDRWEVVCRPRLPDHRRALIGTRGAAADDEGATRAARVRAIAEVVPHAIANRAAVIATLARLAGIDVSRQLVAATLKKGRT